MMTLKAAETQAKAKASKICDPQLEKIPFYGLKERYQKLYFFSFFCNLVRKVVTYKVIKVAETLAEGLRNNVSATLPSLSLQSLLF
jgi:uncharacterized protein YfdQ (DUF2303 family)